LIDSDRLGTIGKTGTVVSAIAKAVLYNSGIGLLGKSLVKISAGLAGGIFVHLLFNII